MRTPLPVSRLARFELRRFRGRVPKLALIFVLLVPLLYSAIYLTANWDPYGKLDQLPVAVINHDRPAKAGDKTITAGDDLVANLHRDRKFDWRDVSDDAAAASGLAQGRYYLTLTIPADFSANLVSGQGDDPQRAKIVLRRDDANGFVVGNVTNSAQNSITLAVDQSAQQSYFDAVFANLATIRAGLVQARDGSTTLADGIGDAATGADKLVTGSSEAQTGAMRLSTGAASLATGLDTAKTGAASLSIGLDKLDTGSKTLATGARSVADGTQQLSDTVLPPLTTAQQALADIKKHSGTAKDSLDAVVTGTAAVAAGVDSAGDDVDQLVREHPELADDPVFKRLRSRITAAGKGADTVASGAKTAQTKITEVSTSVGGVDGLSSKITKAKSDVTKLNTGAHDVADGADTLHSSIGTAASGASTLSAGITKADAGADRLATGATSLATGLTTLHDGAVQLDSGLDKLKTGADTLHTKLAAGAARIPTLTADERADAVQVLSSPADVTTTVDHPAGVYGRGLAPLFLSIALWVFGISVFLVVRPISGRALAGRAGPVRLALASWLPVASIAVGASWLMIATVWLFLGLDPVHPWIFFGITTLAALLFSAIAHLLRTALGTVGSSLLLVLLILQLSSAGGTYPAALVPSFFGAIGPYLPMTYLIDAFRIAISGGLTAHLVRDVTILGVAALVVLGLIVVVVRRRQQFRFADLHPPLTAP